ncbi:MAG TPA: transcriptional regulator [Mycobacteriales bacterium]|nr:transcriptional regulator [Mycobacteriales bacterium]
MTRYTAVAERSGGWWAVRVLQQPGVFTQAKRLDQVEAMVRDALAAFLNLDPSSFDVEVVEVLPETVADDVRQARQARQQATRAQADADAAMRRAAARLVRSGLTVRDIGRVLGVSPQRVSQLTPTSGTPQMRRQDQSAEAS